MLEVSLRPFSEGTLQTVSCSCLNEKVATSRRRSPVIGSTTLPLRALGVLECICAVQPDIRVLRGPRGSSAQLAQAPSPRERRPPLRLTGPATSRAATLMRVLVHLLIRCTLTFLNKIHHRPSKVGPWTTEPWNSSQLRRKGTARRGGFFSDHMQNQSKHKPFMSQQ